MDVERARAFLLTLPHVVEIMQWGDNLVFWAGDKRLGGKMFALINLHPDEHGAISYSVGPERFHELAECEGLKPAPYMARIFWIAAQSWSAWRNSEWEDELRAAHQLTFAKLPNRVREALALPAAEQQKLMAAFTAKAAKTKAAAPKKKAAAKQRTKL